MKTFETIAAEHFKISPEQVTDSLTSKDVPDWDSMNYLLFIADVEKEYNVTFSMDDVLSAKSFGDIRTLLQTKGASV